MTVRETSKAAYGTLPTSPLDKAVYEGLQAKGATTRRALAEFMKMQASTMSGSINRLITRGLVREDGKATCPVTQKIVAKIRAVRGAPASGNCTVDNVTYVAAPPVEFTSTGAVSCQGCVGQRDDPLCSKLATCGPIIWVHKK